jgi:hypothetical protein
MRRAALSRSRQRIPRGLIAQGAAFSDCLVTSLLSVHDDVRVSASVVMVAIQRGDCGRAGGSSPWGRGVPRIGPSRPTARAPARRPQCSASGAHSQASGAHSCATQHLGRHPLTCGGLGVAQPLQQLRVKLFADALVPPPLVPSLALFAARPLPGASYAPLLASSVPRTPARLAQIGVGVTRLTGGRLYAFPLELQLLEALLSGSPGQPCILCGLRRCRQRRR